MASRNSPVSLIVVINFHHLSNRVWCTVCAFAKIAHTRVPVPHTLCILNGFWLYIAIDMRYHKAIWPHRQFCDARPNAHGTVSCLYSYHSLKWKLIASGMCMHSKLPRHISFVCAKWSGIMYLGMIGDYGEWMNRNHSRLIVANIRDCFVLEYSKSWWFERLILGWPSRLSSLTGKQNRFPIRTGRRVSVKTITEADCRWIVEIHIWYLICDNTFAFSCCKCDGRLLCVFEVLI